MSFGSLIRILRAFLLAPVVAWGVLASADASAQSATIPDTAAAVPSPTAIVQLDPVATLAALREQRLIVESHIADVQARRAILRGEHRLIGPWTALAAAGLLDISGALIAINASHAGDGPDDLPVDRPRRRLGGAMFFVGATFAVGGAIWLRRTRVLRSAHDHELAFWVRERRSLARLERRLLR